MKRLNVIGEIEILESDYMKKIFSIVGGYVIGCYAFIGLYTTINAIYKNVPRGTLKKG